MLRIVLINPHLKYFTQFAMPGYETNMSGYPPLSLSYVASIIRASGHEAGIIDSNILRESVEETEWRIKDFNPDIIGFNLATPSFIPLIRYIRELNRNIKLPVIAGGRLVADYPNEIISHPEIDYAFSGGVSESLPRFLKKFENNEKVFSDIEGVCYLDNRGAPVISTSGKDNEIQNLPFPERGLLPLSKYRSPFSMKKNFTAFLTYIGCTFKCVYCTLSSACEFRSVESVIEELKECYFEHSIREIDFYDTVFTLKRERVIELCRRIRKEGIKISWSARTRIELVDRELLREMSSAGCRMIMYGIESLSTKVQENLSRNTLTVKKAEIIIRMTSEEGISPFGFFIFGSPGEKEADIIRSIRFATRSKLKFAQFSKLTPVQGTPLYERYIKLTGYDYWREVIAGKTPTLKLTVPGKRLPDKQIESYIRKANLLFYFSFRRIFGILKTVRNPKELLNMSKSGFFLFYDSIKGVLSSFAEVNSTE